MLISLMTADAFLVKAQDMDCVRPIWNHAKEPKSAGGRATDRPSGDSLTDWLKRSIRFCNIPERFHLAGLIYPLTTPEMINDFKACGGVLFLATGFRMIRVKMFPVADMIPARPLQSSSRWGHIKSLCLPICLPLSYRTGSHIPIP